ncbi:hypothetical protein COMA2_40108 [Candidatus Nitrospira nitrificans]|uniref:Uncharacterized protein n=1 Tax=Candidatus Nitrospira nitrificans TaxID=1742973 RepID=A0A0S4LK22_9BACT|nr:hypothetical protein COMA2_40108 [Candidatus Nitrospira nitrificans]
MSHTGNFEISSGYTSVQTCGEMLHKQVAYNVNVMSLMLFTSKAMSVRCEVHYDYDASC